MAKECEECKSQMRRLSSINSSNAVIETWECPECGFKKELCTGLKF
jgi:DNA-directed RNA polymerase subunit RPC12/RpoP